MAFDDQLAGRIRKQLRKHKGLSEKNMFGGVAFLLNGNMCCGIHKRDLIVRLGVDQAKAALAKPHTRVFDLTGQVFKGWITIKPAGLGDDKGLAQWVRAAAEFASSLPEK